MWKYAKAKYHKYHTKWQELLSGLGKKAMCNADDVRDVSFNEDSSCNN